MGVDKYQLLVITQYHTLGLSLSTPGLVFYILSLKSNLTLYNQARSTEMFSLLASWHNYCASARPSWARNSARGREELPRVGERRDAGRGTADVGNVATWTIICCSSKIFQLSFSRLFWWTDIKKKRKSVKIMWSQWLRFYLISKRVVLLLLFTKILWGPLMFVIQIYCVLSESNPLCARHIGNINSRLTIKTKYKHIQHCS